MLNIFNELTGKLDSLTDGEFQFVLFEPVGKDEIIHGEVPAELRPPFALWHRYMREASEAERNALHNSISKEESGIYTTRSIMLSTKADLLMEACWVGIKDALGLWGIPTIAIREDWQVVEYKDEMGMLASIRQAVVEQGLLRN